MKNIKEYLRTEQVFWSSSDVILIEGIPRYGRCHRSLQ